MVLSRMTRLVSQAEKEGVTLAEIIAREMSPEEMDLAQDALAAHLSDNYENIKGFMCDVHVPSIVDIMSGGPIEVDDVSPLTDLLSDDSATEEEI